MKKTILLLSAIVLISGLSLQALKRPVSYIKSATTGKSTSVSDSNPLPVQIPAGISVAASTAPVSISTITNAPIVKSQVITGFDTITFSDTVDYFDITTDSDILISFTGVETSDSFLIKANAVYPVSSYLTKKFHVKPKVTSVTVSAIGYKK